MEIYVLMRFDLLNFMTLRNSKVQNKKFKSFWKKNLKFLSKYFPENEKEEHFQNDSSF